MNQKIVTLLHENDDPIVLKCQYTLTLLLSGTGRNIPAATIKSWTLLYPPSGYCRPVTFDYPSALCTLKMSATTGAFNTTPGPVLIALGKPGPPQTVN